MKNITEQIIDFAKEPEFWSKVCWISYTNKYNERLICLQEKLHTTWVFPIANLTRGDELSADSTLEEWEKTQPFFEDFMKRICLCLNYCRNKTNEELKEVQNDSN